MLSPSTDVTIYRNQNATEWKDEEIKEIIHSGKKDIKTVLSRKTTLGWKIQKMHYKFLYLNRRQ